MSATEQRPTPSQRSHEALMAAITRNQSAVQHTSGESLSMKQSWKDSHWYCDGLNLSPQEGESMFDVLARFGALAAELERLSGTSNGATSGGEEDVPF